MLHFFNWRVLRDLKSLTWAFLIPIVRITELENLAKASPWFAGFIVLVVISGVYRSHPFPSKD